MTIQGTDKEIADKLTDLVDEYLEDYSFEDLLAEFEITPVEAFIVLFREGFIDESLLERWLTVD